MNAGNSAKVKPQAVCRDWLESIFWVWPLSPSSSSFPHRPVTSLPFREGVRGRAGKTSMAVTLRVHSSRKKSAVEKGTAQWVPIHPSAPPPSLICMIHCNLALGELLATAEPRPGMLPHWEQVCPWTCSSVPAADEHAGDLTEQGQATDSFSWGMGQAMHRASCLPPLQRCGRRCNKKVMMWKRACCCLPGVKSVQFVQGPDIFTLF